MLHMRDQWRTETALAVPPPLGQGFGRRGARRGKIDLRVDLANEPLSLRWLRGAATLSGLCALITLMAPMPFAPLPSARAGQIGPDEAEQLRFLAVSPQESGSKTGLRMAANGLVQPLEKAPERPNVELFATIGSGDSMTRLLVRSGVAYFEASEAARQIAAAVPEGGAPGTNVSIKLGKRNPDGSRPIERLAFRAGIDRNVVLERADDGFAIGVTRIAVDSRPLRIRGRVGDGLYWALRASGASPQAAGEYLRAIGAQLDVGSEIGPNDQFDLIVANRRAATGENREGALLYAAIDRDAAPDIRLMKWNVGGRIDWVDANGASRQVATFAWPVAGRITSGFGRRVHPILRFARMHRGIDFGAGYGAPIVAASDGRVIAAGWFGGYGRQVRIAHAGGIVTTYSHMSRTVAEEGSFVRQGQLIGYVGSSGLSTGPHLHYEVHRNGQAVNPLGVKFANSALLDGPEMERFKARLVQLMNLKSPGNS